jgi:hypothetical protein
MIRQIVDLDDVKIRELVLKEAKEQIKTETGKDPTGSNQITFDTSNTGKLTACVTFQCNGKR